MSDRDFATEIKAIDEQHKALMEKRQAVIADWIEAEHPLKIGYVVEINGSAYEGKQMCVKRRWINFGYARWSWRATGPVLKKDGKEGVCFGEWVQGIEEPK